MTVSCDEWISSGNKQSCHCSNFMYTYRATLLPCMCMRKQELCDRDWCPFICIIYYICVCVCVYDPPKSLNGTLVISCSSEHNNFVQILRYFNHQIKNNYYFYQTNFCLVATALPAQSSNIHQTQYHAHLYATKFY